MEMTFAGYAVAVEGCPAWAIANAARKFMQFKIPEQSVVFCPRPPELRRAVDAELAPVYREIDREARSAALRAEQAQFARRVAHTAEQISRQQEIYQDFCRKHAADRLLSGKAGGVKLDASALDRTPDAPTTWERLDWLKRGGGRG